MRGFLNAKIFFNHFNFLLWLIDRLSSPTWEVMKAVIVWTLDFTLFDAKKLYLFWKIELQNLSLDHINYCLIWCWAFASALETLLFPWKILLSLLLSDFHEAVLAMSILKSFNNFINKLFKWKYLFKSNIDITLRKV